MERNKTKEEEIEFNLPVFEETKVRISKAFYESDSALYGHLIENHDEHPNYFIDTVPGKCDTLKLIETDKEYYRRKFGKENPIWFYGIVENNLKFMIENNELGLSLYAEYSKPNENLQNAFLKARQERF